MVPSPMRAFRMDLKTGKWILVPKSWVRMRSVWLGSLRDERSRVAVMMG